LTTLSKAVDRLSFPAYGGSDHARSLKAVCRYFLPGQEPNYHTPKDKQVNPLLDETAQIGLDVVSNC